MVDVEDKYLWLENPEDPKVVEWFTERDRTARAQLKEISSKLKPRVRKYWAYPYVLLVRTCKNGHFVLLRDSQSFKIVRITSDGAKSELVDSKTLGEDVVLQWIYASDEDRFAYSCSFGGSDEGMLKVVETHSGEILDELRGVIGDVVWLDKERYFYGRFYTKEKTPDGVDPPADRLFLREDGKDELVFGRGVSTSHFITLKRSTQDSKALLAVSYGWTRSDVYGGKLGDPENWGFLYGKGDYMASPVDYVQGKYLVSSFDGGGMGRILTVDPTNGEASEVVGEQACPLQEAGVAENKIVGIYLDDASSILRLYDLKGERLDEICPKPHGTLDSLDSDGNKCILRYESFFIPYRIYVLEKGLLKILDSREVSSDVVVDDLWVKSKDSTPVHGFNVQRRGVDCRRVLAYGYGGFGIALTPRFYPYIVPFIEDGGTFVAANLRGGKEFGEEWHRKGMREKKQNVFDDFGAILEYFKQKGSSIAALGVSNGGLLVGALLTQRPELLEGAVIGYPVLDMLRFDKLHIGRAWVPEYGDPEKAQDAEFLARYSPYHNLQRNKYPPIMLYTGLHDDRVHPAHALKFAARLDEIGASYLLRLETRSGHSGAVPTTKIEEYSDVMAFVYKTLGIKQQV